MPVHGQLLIIIAISRKLMEDDTELIDFVTSVEEATSWEVWWREKA